MKSLQQLKQEAEERKRMPDEAKIARSIEHKQQSQQKEEFYMRRGEEIESGVEETIRQAEGINMKKAIIGVIKNDAPKNNWLTSSSTMETLPRESDFIPQFVRARLPQGVRLTTKHAVVLQGNTLDREGISQIYLMEEKQRIVNIYVPNSVPGRNRVPLGDNNDGIVLLIDWD